jgi:hypothetical protein
MAIYISLISKILTTKFPICTFGGSQVWDLAINIIPVLKSQIKNHIG